MRQIRPGTDSFKSSDEYKMTGKKEEKKKKRLKLRNKNETTDRYRPERTFGYCGIMIDQHRKPVGDNIVSVSTVIAVPKKKKTGRPPRRVPGLS